MVRAYVEVGVATATDSGVAAWSYELELWGRCRQGPDERAAVAALSEPVGRARRPDLVEELTASADHVRRVLLTAPPDLTRISAGETWTTTKLSAAWPGKNDPNPSPCTPSPAPSPPRHLRIPVTHLGIQLSCRSRSRRVAAARRAEGAERGDAIERKIQGCDVGLHQELFLM